MSSDGTTPPLPRFRYDATTGQWKQTAAPPARPQSTSTVGSHTSATSAAAAPESSFDYFLRRAMAGTGDKSRQPRADGREHNGTQVHIAEFERRQKQLMPVGVGGGPTSPNRRSDRRDKGNSCEHTVPSLHPVLGCIVGVSMVAIAEAIAKVTGVPLLRGVPSGPVANRGTPRSHTATPDRTQRQPTELAAQEFLQVLAMVQPSLSLSQEYLLDRVFSTLPCYCPATDSVDVVDFLLFIIHSTHHPALLRNVSMIFRALDPDQRGVIAESTFRSSNVRQWAEVSVFGHLRLEWMSLVAALAEEEAIQETLATTVAAADSDKDGGNGTDEAAATPLSYAVLPSWLDSESLMVVAASSPRLFNVLDSVDLEGSSLRAASRA